MHIDSSIHQWHVGRDRALRLDQPRLMGILNVTPDSFYDGGRYSSTAHAVATALSMHEQGAAIIDVGGESTRPGASPVPASEQIRRTVPVIEGIRSRMSADAVLISIDTTSSEVAKAALAAGADIVNDVSAGRDDARMLPLVAETGCGIILMHRLTAPQQDSYSTRYAQAPDYGGDVVEAVRQFLASRCEAAHEAGIDPRCIVIDPGLGFGKSVAQNFELAGRIHELGELGCPVLSAGSRKSFLGAPAGADSPEQRLPGSLALSIAHWLAGVRLFRVHDVAAHRQALSVVQAMVHVSHSASAGTS